VDVARGEQCVHRSEPLWGVDDTHRILSLGRCRDPSATPFISARG
jgi:hypothetical protein